MCTYMSRDMVPLKKTKNKKLVPKLLDANRKEKGDTMFFKHY